MLKISGKSVFIITLIWFLPHPVTHQAIDDVALMRSIPNMRILEVGDATEIESVLDAADAVDGPVYIRMLRGEVPRLFPNPMKFGVARLLSNNSGSLSRDSDIAIITAGICTEEALKARDIMQSSGISILHIHLSTIVPFPAGDILRVCNMTKFGVITMENHSTIGGIGSATAEVMAEHAVAKPLIRLGVPGGTYAHGASREYLMREYRFDLSALIEAVETLLHRKIGGISSHSSFVRDRGTNNLLERPEDL